MDDRQFQQAREVYNSINPPEDLREKVLLRAEPGAEACGAVTGETANREGVVRGRRRKIYRVGTMAACLAVLLMVWTLLPAGEDSLVSAVFDGKSLSGSVVSQEGDGEVSEGNDGGIDPQSDSAAASSAALADGGADSEADGDSPERSGDIAEETVPGTVGADADAEADAPTDIAADAADDAAAKEKRPAVQAMGRESDNALVCGSGTIKQEARAENDGADESGGPYTGQTSQAAAADGNGQRAENNSIEWMQRMSTAHTDKTDHNHRGEIVNEESSSYIIDDAFDFEQLCGV